MKPVTLSNGETWPTPCLQIWEDNHCERSGFYRAFECASPDATSGVPLVGYCSPGGSFRTIRQTVADARRREPDAKIYRNGKEIV